MANNIKCSKCGSENVSKTGLSHGVGTGSAIPAPISKQYQCLDCKEFSNFPKLSNN